MDWQELVLTRLTDLGTGQQQTLDKLDKLRDATVPRPEFEAYKEEVNRRQQASDDRLALVAREKGEDHGAILARIDKIEDERRTTGRWVVTTALTAFIALAGVVGGMTGAW